MKSEAVTSNAVLNEPATNVRRTFQLGKPVTRYWAEAVVIALALLLWLPRLSGPIDLRWDAGVYYVLGTSLATGHGYRILSEPGSPEAVQYPPLLPAIVALYQRALGSTDPAVVGPWLRISYAALFLAFGLAALALARRHLPLGFAVATVALCLLHFEAIFVSDLLFAEVPLALVTVAFVLVAQTGPRPSPSWAREAAAFVIAATGFFLKTIGIAFLGAWVIESLLRRQWRLALMRGLLAIIPVVLWQAHVARVRGSYEYSHPAYEYQRAPYQFYNVSYAETVVPAAPADAGFLHTRTGVLTMRVVKNVGRIGQRLGEAISSSEEYWRQFLSRLEQKAFGRQIILGRLVLVPILAFSALVIGGMALLMYRGMWLMPLIVLISLGLMCTTPWRGEFLRYLVPLSPFLAIAAMLAMLQISTGLQTSGGRSAVRRFGQIALAALLVVAFIVQIYTASEMFRQRKREGASFVPGRGAVGPHFFFHDLLYYGWEQATDWIEQHSAADAIVAASCPHLCFLRTGRHAVLPPLESDPTRGRQLLDSVPVSYVIVDRGYPRPAIEGDSAAWHLVQSFDGTKLYERTSRAQR